MLHPSISALRKYFTLKSLIPLGVFLVFLFIFLRSDGLKIITGWELETLTLRQRLFSATPLDRSKSNISILAIDGQTLNAPAMIKHFGRTGSWSRDMYGYAIRFLQRGTPKKVIFDMSFNGGEDMGNPTGDAYMVNSLAGTTDFISALEFTSEQNNTLAFRSHQVFVQDLLLKNAINIQGIEKFPNLIVERNYSMIPPFRALLASPMHFYSAKSLSTESAQDPTATIRRWIPFTLYGGYLYPSLTLGAAANHERQLRISEAGVLSWSGGSVRLGRDGLPLIKWYGDQTRTDVKKVYPQYHFWDVVESELVLQCRENPGLPICTQFQLPGQPVLKPEAFKNQYVLINMTQENSYDKHNTIYGPIYPGVYMVANQLDNLINDDFVLQAPLWMDAAAFLLLCGLTLWLCFRFRSIIIAVLGTGALLIFYFCATYYAYSNLNLWINFICPALGVMVIFTCSYVYQYTQSERLRQQLRFAFGKYVSPAVLSRLERNPDAIKLGGQRRELTLLFCDIRGFTSFSENNDPEIVQHFLTQYFSVMNDMVMNKFGGSINKLMGDAIMAYWGFPLEKEDHAFWAVSAAMAMRDVLDEWHQDPEKPPLNIGIGINTGTVLIGNVGSKDFMDFTVIGDAVNLASRLESMNKEFGTNIIISEFTYEKIKDRLEARSLGFVKVRGKEQEIQIFEPVGLKFF
jgi:class 3 adenylate cyclase/CHASE2 domain-containing sensor protein